MAIEWNEKVQVGIETVDNDHKELFAIMNQAMELSPESPEFIEIITSLESYILNHFAREEQMMREYVYTGITSHRQKHIEFMRDFSNIKVRFQMDGPIPENLSRIQYLLSEWWIRHVSETDKAMAVYINKRISES